jgi:hypothetical protein
MQNVLFKTSDPIRADGMVEFYVVFLSLQGDAAQSSAVQERHGWLNTETGKVTLDPGYSSPPGTFDSFSEAVDRYCALRIERAKAGFVHAFSWDGFVGEPSNHRQIDIETDPRARSSNKWME